MSWPDRRSLALLALGALAGCGFRPLYGEGGEGRAELSIRDAATPEDFAFRERLRLRLAPRAGLAGRIDFSLDFEEEGVAITPQADVTRYLVTARASYRFEPDDGDAPVEGRLSTVGGYDAGGDALPARAAERRGRERLAEDLAERVATRILAAKA